MFYIEKWSFQALKEEKLIHEKVTIPKVYLHSLAMAIHRISKEDPAKLIGNVLFSYIFVNT